MPNFLQHRFSIWHTILSKLRQILIFKALKKNILTKIGLIPEIISRYRSTYFIHIIGGYDSGYYSYTWAAVLIMMLSKHLRKKVSSTGQLLDHSAEISLRKTEQWMQCRCMLISGAVSLKLNRFLITGDWCSIRNSLVTVISWC